MIKPIKDAYLDLFQFLKKPADQSSNNQTIKEKVTKLFLILILDIAVAGIGALLIYVLESTGLVSMENHKIMELIKSMPKGVLILLLVLIVPLLEEIIFRLYLRYKNNFLLRFFILLFYVAGKENKERIEKRIKKIWYKQYAYVFYFSAVLFGFVHIFNFDDASLWIFPILTLPQICMGVFAGYLRVRYNLFMGFFLHALHNLILLLPFLFMGGSIEALNNDTDDYLIKIEENTDSDSKGSIKFFPDSIYFQECKLKKVIAYTNKTKEWLVESDRNIEMNRELSLSYKNKSDSTFIDKKVINKHLEALYKYKKSKEYKPTHVWKLVIEDSIKLISHRTDSVARNYISITKDSVIMHSVKLPGVAYGFGISKKKKIFLNDNIEGQYNIKLNTRDSIDFKKQLSSIYGLKLVDSVANIEHLIIDFENGK